MHYHVSYYPVSTGLEKSISEGQLRLELGDKRLSWFGHGQEGSWMYWTKGVKDGATRQEEKRKLSEEVKRGWCDRGGCLE